MIEEDDVIDSWNKWDYFFCFPFTMQIGFLQVVLELTKFSLDRSHSWIHQCILFLFPILYWNTSSFHLLLNSLLERLLSQLKWSFVWSYFSCPFWLQMKVWVSLCRSIRSTPLELWKNLQIKLQITALKSKMLTYSSWKNSSWPRPGNTSKNWSVSCRTNSYIFHKLNFRALIRWWYGWLRWRTIRRISRTTTWILATNFAKTLNLSFYAFINVNLHKDK